MKPRQPIEHHTSTGKPKWSRKSARPQPDTYKVELVYVPRPDSEERFAKAYAIIFQAAVRDKTGDVFTV
jgi:hypothetical protein